LNKSDTNLQKGTTPPDNERMKHTKLKAQENETRMKLWKGPHETRMKLRNFKWRQSQRETNGEEIVFGGAEVGDTVNEIYCNHSQLYLNEGHYCNFWGYRRSVGGAGRSTLLNVSNQMMEFEAVICMSTNKQ